MTVSIFVGRQPADVHAGRAEPSPSAIYVDALSGKDGRPLWWWHVDIPTDQFTSCRGTPMVGPRPGRLAAPGRPARRAASRRSGRMSSAPPSDPYPPIVHILEASTGREVQTLTGLRATPSVADLDGDGLTDLWGEAEGQLRAFRGEAPEAWRALGAFYPARDSAYLRRRRSARPPTSTATGSATP